MDEPHQEITKCAEAQLHEYTRRLMNSMGDKRHFVFASGCKTCIVMPWENLVHFRNAAREYGRIP